LVLDASSMRISLKATYASDTGSVLVKACDQQE
jgi:hypothetical protein